MIDADHFKAINDTHGHDVGDEALKKIAEVLRKGLDTGALIGRLGGEEFGIFLPGATEVEAVAAADTLCALMRREAKVIAGKELNLTLSIGCALHRDKDTLEATMKLADFRALSCQARRSRPLFPCRGHRHHAGADPQGPSGGVIHTRRWPDG